VVLPALPATGRVACLGALGRRFVVPQAGSVKGFATSENTAPYMRLSYGCELGEDLWETLSFTAIWLCGIGVITACFV
jgi:hypothetical protein